MVCLVWSVVIPAVLEFDRDDTDVPDTGLTVDVGRCKVVAVRVPGDASDLSFVSIASALEFAVANKRSGNVVFVD